MKRFLFNVLESTKSKTTTKQIFNYFLFTLIILNAVISIASTVKEFYVPYKKYLDVFELFSIIFFTIEYLLRVIVCTEHKGFSHPITGRLRFMLQYRLLIDLMAFLPFYLLLEIPLDLRFLRLLRLARLFRVFRIEKLYLAFCTIRLVIKQELNTLGMTCFLVLILLVMSSALMYYAEGAVQPESFSSIPETMWWSVMTLTTVGYGDVYPVTVYGKLIASVTAILGLGLVALPTAILSGRFLNMIKYRKYEEEIVCPHCKKKVKLENIEK